MQQQENILENMEATLRKILDEKLAFLPTKNDVDDLKESINNLLGENNALKKEVMGLKMKNKTLKRKLVNLEDRAR